MSPSEIESGRPGELVLPDGRILALLEVGVPGGPLVIHQHGGPSSRLEVRLFAGVARSLGVRLVGVDRPGMGRSSPQADRTFEGWSQDLLAIADRLGAETFGVTGWSEGGPWALAAAAYLPPERLRHVTSIAGGSYGTFGANWAAPLMDRIDALGGRLALHFEPGFRLMYGLLGFEATHARRKFLAQLAAAVSEADRAVLADPAIAEAFLASSAECFAPGSDGLVRDAKVLYEAWPFEVADIRRPVHVWQGMDDRLVPPEINRRVADATPGAVWHPVAPGGHFIALSEARAIFSIARAEIRG